MASWPEYMSTETASRYLDVPAATLISWRQRGVGPEWVKIPPRLVRYERAAIDRWLEARKRKPGTLQHVERTATTEIGE